MKVRLSILWLGFAPACLSLNESPDEAGSRAASAPAPIIVSAPAGANPSDPDMELRMAKLWARVDALESQHLQQKERLKLLEKGLMLGIIPDELKRPEGDATKKEGQPAKPKQEEQAVEPTLSLSTSKAKEETPRNEDLNAYRRALQDAQEKFNAANYGQAIVAYNKIGEEFADSLTEGSHHYWVGLSWYYLKEFHLAEQSFQKLQQKYSANPWVAHSRFYQAKIDESRGLHQRALEQFTQLLEEFPQQDLGEMAKMEIERLREKL